MHYSQHPNLTLLYAIGNDKRCPTNDQFPRTGHAPLPARHGVPGK